MLEGLNFLVTTYVQQFSALTTNFWHTARPLRTGPATEALAQAAPAMVGFGDSNAPVGMSGPKVNM